MEMWGQPLPETVGRRRPVNPNGEAKVVVILLGNPYRIWDIMGYCWDMIGYDWDIMRYYRILLGYYWISLISPLDLWTQCELMDFPRPFFATLCTTFYPFLRVTEFGPDSFVVQVGDTQWLKIVVVGCGFQSSICSSHDNANRCNNDQHVEVLNSYIWITGWWFGTFFICPFSWE